MYSYEKYSKADCSLWNHFTSTGNHMPYGGSPGSGDFSHLYPKLELVSYPRGMQGWVGLDYNSSCLKIKISYYWMIIGLLL